jgi:molybdopterin molybdotransferase
MSLPDVETALAAMLAQIAPLPTEAVTLNAADGRWLARDVSALRDQPPFDASAMDGWAVRSVDAVQDAVLSIVGESAAGRSTETPLAPGQTIRISTGAALPTGADRVIMQEDVEHQGDRIRLMHPAGDGRHIRPRGCDFRQGERLLGAGERLNPWRLALAASVGVAELTCRAMPLVTILSTGDELVEPGQAARPDQIYNSGGPSLSAFVKRHSGRVDAASQVGDTREAIARAVTDARFDILITIGGASVGDHDLVKPVLRDLGATLFVEGVALRPGKPVWFGVLADGRPVLGLPGNPASALVCAELFLGPLLARLQGGAAEDRFETAVLDIAMPKNGPRDHYARARVVAGPDGARRVTPFADQDSSLVTVMSAANALVRRPPHAPAAEAGTVVPILGPTL